MHTKPLPVRSLRPEDAEVATKLEELTGLQSQLADLELQLCNLRLELSEFESLDCAKIGPVYAELDELDALIAERIAQKATQLQGEEAFRSSRVPWYCIDLGPKGWTLTRLDFARTSPIGRPTEDGQEELLGNIVEIIAHDADEKFTVVLKIS